MIFLLAKISTSCTANHLQLAEKELNCFLNYVLCGFLLDRVIFFWPVQTQIIISCAWLFGLASYYQSKFTFTFHRSIYKL